MERKCAQIRILGIFSGNTLMSCIHITYKSIQSLQSLHTTKSSCLHPHLSNENLPLFSKTFVCVVFFFFLCPLPLLICCTRTPTAHTHNTHIFDFGKFRTRIYAIRSTRRTAVFETRQKREKRKTTTFKNNVPCLDTGTSYHRIGIHQTSLWIVDAAAAARPEYALYMWGKAHSGVQCTSVVCIHTHTHQ